MRRLQTPRNLLIDDDAMVFQTRITLAIQPSHVPMSPRRHCCLPCCCCCCLSSSPLPGLLLCAVAPCAAAGQNAAPCGAAAGLLADGHLAAPAGIAAQQPPGAVQLLVCRRDVAMPNTCGKNQAQQRGTRHLRGQHDTSYTTRLSIACIMCSTGHHECNLLQAKHVATAA